MIVMGQLSTSKWLNEHYKELQDRYPDKYIAIQDDNILATGDTIEEAYMHAKSVSSKKFVLEYIQKQDIFLNESL